MYICAPVFWYVHVYVYACVYIYSHIYFPIYKPWLICRGGQETPPPPQWQCVHRAPRFWPLISFLMKRNLAPLSREESTDGLYGKNAGANWQPCWNLGGRRQGGVLPRRGKQELKAQTMFQEQAVQGGWKGDNQVLFMRQSYPILNSETMCFLRFGR